MRAALELHQMIATAVLAYLRMQHLRLAALRQGLPRGAEGLCTVLPHTSVGPQAWAGRRCARAGSEGRAKQKNCTLVGVGRLGLCFMGYVCARVRAGL